MMFNTKRKFKNYFSLLDIYRKNIKYPIKIINHAKLSVYMKYIFWNLMHDKFISVIIIPWFLFKTRKHINHIDVPEYFFKTFDIRLFDRIHVQNHHSL